MNEQQFNQRVETDIAALPARIIPPFHPAQHRRPCNAQLALPVVPRCQSRFAGCAVAAARHIAEFDAWQANGGDYLLSSLAPRFLHTNLVRTN